MNTNQINSYKDLDTEGKNSSQVAQPLWANLKYFLMGIVFGVLLVKAEIISWYRIQEMFHFQSFHMYGVIGSAVVTGIISVQLIRILKVRTLDNEEIVIPPKRFHRGMIYGGLSFGFGWALTGACPGPIFAQIGSGYLVAIVTLASAILGTWVYGLFQSKLPH